LPRGGKSSDCWYLTFPARYHVDVLPGGKFQEIGRSVGAMGADKTECPVK